MVNRYDEPASYGYISQYVPIPFEKLYALGKDYADQRKQAEKELETNIKKRKEVITWQVIIIIQKLYQKQKLL